MNDSEKKLIADEFNADDVFTIHLSHDVRVSEITHKLLHVLDDCKDISMNSGDLAEVQITSLAVTIAYMVDNSLIDEAGLEGRMKLIDYFCTTIKNNLELFYKSRLKNNQIGH